MHALIVVFQGYSLELKQEGGWITADLPLTRLLESALKKGKELGKPGFEATANEDNLKLFKVHGKFRLFVVLVEMK